MRAALGKTSSGLRFVYRALSAQEGIALLMVLWVTVLLGVIVTEFAYSMRTEVWITQNYKEDAQSYYLSRAGINLALAEILADWDYQYVDESGRLVFANRSPAVDQGAEEPEVIPSASLVDRLEWDDGRPSYEIVDEERKISVNMAVRSKEVLHAILRESGVTDLERRSIIVDSLVDWVDENDLKQLNGAEDAYYQQLDPPYRAKDAPIDTLDELLLVRGMTKEILYGGPKDVENRSPENRGLEERRYKGLIHFLTTVPTVGVNINTAPEEVLRALGVTDAEMALLLSNRQRPTLQDTLTRFPRAPLFRPIVQSQYFTIRSVGELPDGRRGRAIRAVVRRVVGSGNRVRHIVLQWDDNDVRGPLLEPTTGTERELPEGLDVREERI